MQRQPPLAFDLINAAAVFSALNVGSMSALPQHALGIRA
jgi:hypothetical protein